MTPSDVESYVRDLEGYGLQFQVDGKARDIAVADQLRRMTTPCDWLEFGHVDLEAGSKQGAACRLKGSTSEALITPEGWQFEGSLSQTFGFVRSERVDRSLKFLRHQNGMDVYLNELTEEEVFVGPHQLIISVYTSHHSSPPSTHPAVCNWVPKVLMVARQITNYYSPVNPICLAQCHPHRRHSASTDHDQPFLITRHDDRESPGSSMGISGTIYWDKLWSECLYSIDMAVGYDDFWALNLSNAIFGQRALY